jgi:lactoylglutathione lyase
MDGVFGGWFMESQTAAVALTLLVLKTRQVEVARAFYETLGIRLAAEQHGTGPLHYAGSVGNVTLEVYPLLGDEAAADKTTRLGFAVADLEQVLESLKEGGSVLVSPPKRSPWGLRAVVEDPDGRAVELYEHERRSP